MLSLAKPFNNFDSTIISRTRKGLGPIEELLNLLKNFGVCKPTFRNLRSGLTVYMRRNRPNTAPQRAFAEQLALLRRERVI